LFCGGLYCNVNAFNICALIDYDRTSVFDFSDSRLMIWSLHAALSIEKFAKFVLLFRRAHVPFIFQVPAIWTIAQKIEFRQKGVRRI